MAQTKLGESIVNTSGKLPEVGSQAPDFVLTQQDLKDVSLKDFSGKNLVLNIFPSVDTKVCAMSVREFNKRAANLANTMVLCISKDLPFAQKRFCAAEGVENVVMLSEFRNKKFSDQYNVEMIDGGLAGLHARAVIVIDPKGVVKHVELTETIGQEPDYEKALSVIK